MFVTFLAIRQVYHVERAFQREGIGECKLMLVSCWWLIEIPCWFIAVFGAEILEILILQYAKDNFT